MFGAQDAPTYWPSGVYPSHMLTWDRYSSRVATELGIHPFLIGHPDAELVAAPKRSNQDEEKYVCVSLGKLANDSEDPWGCFPRELCEAIDGLNRLGIGLLMRPHPTIAADNRTFRLLSRWILNRFGNLRIDNPRDVALSESISDSFLNLTWTSATWFEFALAGKSTIVLNQKYAEWFQQHAAETGIWGSDTSPVQSMMPNEEYFDAIKNRAVSLKSLCLPVSQPIELVIQEISSTGQKRN
jgi:hypothetical protein